jgi:DNA-binding MarR family transcriptional regulator
MEKAGLVRRVEDPDDGRSWRIEPAGLDARERARVVTALETLDTDASKGLTAAERRELIRLLHKLTLTLDAE